MTAILFDRYEFYPGNTPSIDLRGAIAFTQNIKKTSLVNKTITWGQRLHNKKCIHKHNPYVTHTFIVLNNASPTRNWKTPSFLQKIHNLFIKCINWLFGKNYSLHPFRDPQDRELKIKFKIAHGVRTGCQIEYQNHLDPESYESKEIKKIIYYVPKDENLRKAIISQAKRLCAFQGLKRHLYSFGDIFNAFVAKQTIPKKPTKRQMKRCALAVADLVLQKRFKNQSNRPRPLHCVGFAILTYQACVLEKELSTSQKTSLLKLNNRKKIAKKLFQKIKNSSTNDPFAKAFWENKICQFNIRCHSTAHAKTLFDIYSEKHKVA